MARGDSPSGAGPARVSRSGSAGRVTAEDTRVAMRDGTWLATDVFVSDDGAPRPAMVLRGPYSRNMARQTMDPVALARLGWNVVIQDCRGRFESEGEFDPFHQEGTDGADTIAWAAQQPWCDGRVVTHGASYFGLTQWLAALEQPEPLKAIAPLSVGGDVRDGWTFEGGAFQLGLVAPWAMAFPMTAPGTAPAIIEQGVELTRDWDAFLRIPPATNPLGDMFPVFRRWLDPDDEAYWGPLSIRRSYRRLDVPAFQLSGWYDVFAESALQSFGGMRAHAPSEHARRSQRLVMGPWTHTGLYLNASPEFNFGPAANALADNLPGKILDWLRAAVDDEEVEGGVRVYVMGGWNDGAWRELPDWPPPSVPTTWYLDADRGANGLGGDGALRRRPGESAATDRYLYDPQRPVPTRGGRTMGPFFPLAGPVDQRPVEEREDVLVYTSEPLDRDVVVMGMVTADITFSTSGRSADVTVKLCDVYPDGRSYNIVDSVRRETFAPGRAKGVAVAVGSVAQRFKAGHRIRVEISSSNFPRLDRNASNGRTTAEATSYESAVQTVHRGGSRPSSVTLPLVDA